MNFDEVLPLFPGKTIQMLKNKYNEKYEYLKLKKVKKEASKDSDNLKFL